MKNYKISLKDKEILDSLLNELNHSSNHMLGYPITCSTLDYDYLIPFMSYMLNNLGEPLLGGNYKLNTFKLELEIIKFFGKLLHCNDCWGYVTSGGSEGNLKGLLTGRDLYPHAMAYFSDQSHYSIFKAASLLGLDSIIIKSNVDGSIDTKDFSKRLCDNKNAIVSLNIGTTMLCGVDNWVEIIKILRRRKVKYYLHFDAALLGLIYPFVYPNRLDFKHFNSIAISGHKMLGCPVPCGLFLSDKMTQGDMIDYINGSNRTLLGSRSGLAPITIWYAIKKYGEQGLKERARSCIDKAKYLYSLLRCINYPGLRVPSVNTVVFNKPSEHICHKWQLATSNGLSHVIIMPSTSNEMLVNFVDDLKNS